MFSKVVKVNAKQSEHRVMYDKKLEKKYKYGLTLVRQHCKILIRNLTVISYMLYVCVMYVVTHTC